MIDTLSRGVDTDSSAFDRDDVIWVCTMLRCGADPDEALRIAPGIGRARLVAAYRTLEGCRAVSYEAWAAIVADPTGDSVARNAQEAAKLLPAACRALLRAGPSNRVLADMVANLDAQVRDRWAAADDLARRLELPGVNLDKVREAGARLWNPSAENLWNDPLFLPRRVGELTPAATAELLADVLEPDGSGGL